MKVETIKSIHIKTWSKLTVTDMPTDKHGMYDSVKGDEMAPQHLGSMVAKNISPGISTGVKSSIAALDEQLAKKTSGSNSNAPSESSSFADKLNKFSSASTASSATAPLSSSSSPSPLSSAPRAFGPPSLSAPTVSRSIGSATKDALGDRQTWLDTGKTVTDSGRCFTFAAKVVYDLVAAGFTGIEVFGSSSYDHYFVVYNRLPSSTPTDMSTWGKGTVIVDAWQANVAEDKSPCYKIDKFRYNKGLKLICKIS